MRRKIDEFRARSIITAYNQTVLFVSTYTYLLLYFIIFQKHVWVVVFELKFYYNFISDSLNYQNIISKIKFY